MSYVNIQYIWSNQLLQESFSNLKTLVVGRCGFLVKIIPFHILKCLTNLGELVVFSCDSLEMVFDFEELKNANKKIHPLLAGPLKKLKLSSLPKLKHVWSNDPKGIVSFQSLRHVEVSLCGSLTSMFPASIAKSLLDLEELRIQLCGIEVIVAKDEVLEYAATFEFPRLTSLYLYGLDNMKNFYPHIHLLECPGLRSLDIRDCDELEIFEKEISSSSRSKEEKARHTKYPLVFQEKVSFLNLEILNISSLNIQYIWSDQLPYNSFSNLKALLVEACDFLVKVIPFHILKYLSNLEEVEVRGCRSLEMVFDFEELKNTDKEIHSLLVVPLKRLLLLDLPKLKHVWSTDSQVSFPNLEILKIFSLNIQYIWSDQFPHNSFNKLKALHVEAYDFLVKIIPLRMENCLSNLEEVEVRGCRSLEMVFDSEELKNTNKEIHSSLVVPLKKLLLLDLPKLKHVWSTDSKGGENK